AGKRRRVRDHGWCRPVARTRELGVPKELRRMSEEPKLEELDRLISVGKQKGFLTYDEVNDALPSDLVSLDQLDDIMMMFGAMDIEVVDSAKAGRLPSEVRERKAQQEPDDNDNEEEFTEEKEADLTRQVTAAFAMVDRLLRERDKLLDQARKLRQKASGRRRPRKGKEPAWKRFETQAQQRQTRVLEKLRALNI